MQQILDLHIHSRYSRACSPDLTLENIEAVCRRKGIDIVATGDFTHPAWLSSIKNNLREYNKSGLYVLKNAPDQKIKFILSTELALIYKDDIRCRRLHLVVLAPDLEAASALQSYLDRNYNVRSDGRPILGMSAPDLVKLCLSIDQRFLIIPAHIWTPWFSIFGSKSGFNSFEECFQDQSRFIYGYETGLSSDPLMNYRVSKLSKYTMLSNSDAHSLGNIGREANIFEMTDVTYQEIFEIITQNDQKKIIGTIEFYPEEGMYHYDGHRDCCFSCDPLTTRQLNSVCPVCHKPLVIGVMNRVEELTDREIKQQSRNLPKFWKLVELDKIIAASLNIKSRQSKKVIAIYDDLLDKTAMTELELLINSDIKEIEKIGGFKIAEGVHKVRMGQLEIMPGFDGQYGKIKIY